MDLAAICEVLQATQQADGATRKAAEEKLNTATSNSPNELCEALVGVITAGNSVPEDLRLEAAVILRQAIAGTECSSTVWAELRLETQELVKAQCLACIESDPVPKVRRSVSQAAVAIVEHLALDFDDLMTQWPQFLPAVYVLVGPSKDPDTRVAALNMLKELQQVSEGLLNNGGQQMLSILQSTLQDQSAEVRAAGTQLILQFISLLDRDDTTMLGTLMPTVVGVIQGLANPKDEELLKMTLQALTDTFGQEPEFFKENAFQPMWETLMRITASGTDVFADATVRHDAMEAAMTLATSLSTDFSKADAAAQLEHLIGLNLEWMLEVETDVAVWTAEGKEDDDDDCDGDVVGIAEQNLDRFGGCFEEDVLMPILFKVAQKALNSAGADWRHTRAAVMAMSQVAEHIEEESWVSRIVDFVAQYTDEGGHPRLRYAAFQALGQIIYDQSQYVQESYPDIIIPKVTNGMDDENIRVATSSVSALVSFIEDSELDYDDLKPYLEELLLRIFHRLFEGSARAMKEQCLTAIGLLADAVEENFLPYYNHVVPALKKIINESTSKEDRMVRGKAFECISVVGASVGKEAFLSDAGEVMRVMITIEQAGLEDDDPLKDAINTAAANIAETLEKEFKPYVQPLLPRIFGVLKQKPVELPANDDFEDDDDDEEVMMVAGKRYGLKTAVMEEMIESLGLINTMVESLEEEFCDFLSDTCTNLRPLLESKHMAEDLRKAVFKTWETLAGCARQGAEAGKVPVNIVQDLLTAFLQATVGATVEIVTEIDTKPLEVGQLALLQMRTTGAAGVIKRSGVGALSKEMVLSIMDVALRILSKIGANKDEAAGDTRKGKKNKDMDDDEDGCSTDSEDDQVTQQSVRFCLADLSAAVMKSSPENFTEVMPRLMEIVHKFVQPGASEPDRALAFYMTADIVNHLGATSVQYWNFFMNQVLEAILDQSIAVRQYAATTLGYGAKQPAFQPMTMAAAGQIHAVLSKHGEKHRRRRAVKADAKQLAVSLDAAIWCLGNICEHHGQQLGNNLNQAWVMWLNHMPLKYSEELGQSCNEKLLRLIMAQHPVLTTQDNLPKALAVFADTYKTKFSTSSLDKAMTSGLAAMAPATLKGLSSSLPERQQKKIQSIVQGGQPIQEDPAVA